MYGICIISLAPGRAQPADQSEMVTQLLFGECFTIVQKKRKWTRIKMQVDDYECWLDNKQYKPIAQDMFESLAGKSQLNRQVDDVMAVSVNGQRQYLLKGSVIENEILSKFKVDIQTSIPDAALHPVQYARQYLNAPYLWGGRSPFGIDCSGLVQMCYLLAGKNVPRDAWQQAALGETVDFIEEVTEGDLAFFDNPEGKIVHVGFVINNGMILHASGKVRIDKIDHQGIYNKELKTYTHKLRIIKRIR
jgi:gamma-D-glutamyl-L-lysine dipeptidyl-peptidase